MIPVDAPLVAAALGDVPAAAAELERLGFSGTYTFEGPHDPFLPLLLAAEHTDHLELMTAVAIAFARNPMTVAQLGWDLAGAAPGRVTVGLGTQIRAHIERRFSMPWSEPAARMRDFVLAVRAIWDTWATGTPLDHHGSHYTHTLMTPFFTPPSLDGPTPRIALAGIGPAMTRVAAEVADGFVIHPFSTPGFIAERTRPILDAWERGARPDFTVAWPVMIATGADEIEVTTATLATRAQIAFYASTPAYRPVLDHHGRGDLQPRLRDLSKTGDWEAMSAQVDDELFDLVAIRGTPEACAQELAARTRGLVTRIGINAPYSASADTWARLLKAFHAAADESTSPSRSPAAP